jgi:Tfp pilus assembly protein PilO
MKRLLTVWTWWRVDLAGAAALAALTAAVVLGGVLPLMANHKEYLALHSELAVQRDQAARLEVTMETLRQKLESARRTVDGSPLHLAAAGTVNRRLTEVSALAGDVGLVIDDIRPDRSVPGTHCETIPIAVAGSGTYRTCTLFLARLRRTMPDTSVSALELAAGGLDATGAGKFRMDLRWHAAPRSAEARPASEASR